MNPQRGAVLLLMAFSVLTFATAAAFLAHRNALRELAMEGDARQGARAAQAAEAALAWFLAEGWTDLAGARAGDRLVQVPASVLDGAEADLRVRFLGPGADPGEELWRLTLQGTVRAGTLYRQVREAYVATPAGAPGAPPALRAWRIVR